MPRSPVYGLQRGQTPASAGNVSLARRLVERGVRFVELIDVGSSDNWDAHGDMMTHEPLAKNVDQPIAGLLQGSETTRHARRHAGRLDDRIRPHAVQQHGRRQGPRASSTGPSAPGSPARGVKPGIVHGATDEIGIRAVENRSTSTTSTPRSCT